MQHCIILKASALLKEIWGFEVMKTDVFVPLCS